MIRSPKTMLGSSSVSMHLIFLEFFSLKDQINILGKFGFVNVLAPFAYIDESGSTLSIKRETLWGKGVKPLSPIPFLHHIFLFLGWCLLSQISWKELLKSRYRHPLHPRQIVSSSHHGYWKPTGCSDCTKGFKMANDLSACDCNLPVAVSCASLTLCCL